MPDRCIVPHCRSGYGKKKAEEGVSIHSFPKELPSDDPETKEKKRELLKKWLVNIRRDTAKGKAWEPTKTSRICSLHFEEDCFRTESIDKQKDRLKKREEAGGGLGQRLLKEDAFPTIFPYKERLQPKAQTPRTSQKATAESRRTAKGTEVEQQGEELLAQDRITSLDDISRMMKGGRFVVPGGFVQSQREDKLLLFLMEIPDHNTPSLRASITIEDNLSYSVAVDGRVIPPSQYDTDDTVTMEHFTKLTNLMTMVKEWVANDAAPEVSPLITAKESLSKYVDSFGEENEMGIRKAAFLLEQLELLDKDPKGRRFSPPLLAFAQMIRSPSTKAYETLRNLDILTLPSRTTLDAITRSCKVGIGAADERYFQMRLNKEPKWHKEVNLIIDEVYVAERVELSQEGAVVGMTADSKAARTVLVFMVCSIRTGYQDVIGIYPVRNLTAEMLKIAFMQVLHVIVNLKLKLKCVITDNLRTNRSFFTDLGGGQLKSEVTNPLTGEPLFLLIDPVHIMKKVYSNWQLSKEPFIMPPIPGSNARSADFGHVAELYRLEAAKPVKMAHKLTKTSIEPSNIDRMKVTLSVAVFHESTVNALKWHCEHEGKPWQETLEFVTLFHNMWNILNVRTPHKDIHKRNDWLAPVTKVDGRQMKFLAEVEKFLTEWLQSKKKGFSRDTFIALIHMCKTLRELVSHLLAPRDGEPGWEYVMLAKFSSDKLESRFSSYRQFSGGLHFISLKQLLSSERKIRANSALKYSGCSTKEIKDLPSLDTIFHASVVSAAPEFSEKVAKVLDKGPQPDATDANITYHVAGYCARSHITCVRGCEECKDILIDKDGHELPVLQIDGQLPEDVTAFLNQINRGGLWVPSSYAFAICLKAWKVYSCIKGNEELKTEFLESANQTALFVESVVIILRDYDKEIDDSLVADLRCPNGHDFGRVLFTKFFRVMVKNLVKELSTEAAAEKLERKAAKLKSNTKR